MTLWAGRVGTSWRRRWDFLRADDAELLPYDCGATPSTRRACTRRASSPTTSWARWRRG